MRLHVAILGVVALVGACATDVPLLIQTPSGRPETVFRDTTLQEAQGRIVAGCFDRGLAVVASTEFQVVCEVPMDMGQAIIAQAFIGNAYSTPARQFAQFSLAQVGKDVRVQGASWVETQMAFGQVNRMPTDQTNAQKNDLQIFLQSVGGLPPAAAMTADAEAAAPSASLLYGAAAEVSREPTKGAAGD